MHGLISIRTWDPYSNTGTIPVAVVSVDKGYTKSDGEFVVMGDTVIDNLKENDKIGWQFVKTEDEAVDGVYSGDYYAAIVIGENFSESMYGFADNDLVHSFCYLLCKMRRRIQLLPRLRIQQKERCRQCINEEFVNVAGFHCYGKYE